MALPEAKKGKGKPNYDREVDCLVTLAQQAVGTNYEVTINSTLLVADENDYKGGRSDDAVRAREVQSALADDNIAALVTVRGGAWFVRLMDQIDFDVLKRRKRPIHIFGFSEMTPLIAVCGMYPKAVALYDLGPGFLYGGVKRHVEMNIAHYARNIELKPEEQSAFAAGWAVARFRIAVADFFTEVVDIVEGRGTARVPVGRLLSGKLPSSSRIQITGGNLSLTAPMMGTQYAAAFETEGKWLAVEDLNEDPEQCDRMIAGLKHNGLLEAAEGIILGDFHNKQGKFTEAVLQLLQYQLPKGKRTPVVEIENFGHIWPIAPIPMNREVTLKCKPDKSVSIDIPWGKWKR
jgi:muramoyltetrapeptide carboxypeptidase LdcA involved in peptidoglycan recycling